MSMSNAIEIWNHIERLLTEECGLPPDEGLKHQRPNCINAIRNGMPDAALINAAIDFMNSGEGLFKVRVNGVMMNRKQVARALSFPNGDRSHD
jgi:hypothetical protein